METNSTNKLITIVENKGIEFNRGDKTLFRKYSYFQVINAYKNLFAVDEDDLDEIKNNITNGVKIDFYRKAFEIKSEVLDSDLYENICNKICKKYGLIGNTLLEKEEQIKEIKYHHHIYNNGTLYTDFIRMYKFEHELRMILLKYTLIVEENVKNIFISYLNDINAKPNYLINMDNYNTTSLKSKSFDTLKLIIDKYDNLKSKPIKRKRDQHLTVPYWILINELAMNQTYYAMANLNSEDSYKIFLRCLNFFTQLNFSEENRGKSQRQLQYENKLINNFKTLLYYLGEFRNMLAHNQPIYCYNVSEYDIDKNTFKYELPKTKSGLKDKQGNLVTETQQQINLMGTFMNCLKDYYGADNFNSNNSTKLDLSKIIYVLYKMLKNIDGNTEFYTELTAIYSKYNIILSESIVKVNNPKKIDEAKQSVNELLNFNLETVDLIDTIDKGQAYKRKLKAKERELKMAIKKTNDLLKNINVEIIKSKYKHFPAGKKYTEFTGINSIFFKSLN